MLDIVPLTRQLVSIPSVNPMGRSGDDPTWYEHRLTDAVERILRELGLAVDRQPVADRRDNLLARLDGAVPPEQGGPLLMLEVHQDTVPADGMVVDPWAGEVRDRRLFGRGACDVKGGLAAVLTAVARLAEQRPDGMPTILVACSVNEEYGFTGARKLTERWTATPGGLLPRRPDAAIVLEPTLLDVVVAHKGVVRWRCHTRGVAAHSAAPDRGENAIYRMAEVVAALRRYAETVLPQQQHATLGPATLSVGTIAGGVSVNTVPDRCTIDVDRRLLPEESPETAWQAACNFVAEHVEPAAEAVEHDVPYMASPSLGDDGNDALADALCDTLASLGHAPQRRVVPYATDAATLSAAGVPCVVFGPGSIEQAHTADEWIAIEQLEQAAEALYRFCAGGFSAHKKRDS